MSNKLSGYLLILLSVLFLTLLFPMTVHADTYIDENGIERDVETDFIVDRGEDDKSITDVMDTWGDRNKPNQEQMVEGTSVIQRVAGTALSVIIYVIFAAFALTTATDLMYIAVPALRPVLYNANNNMNISSLQNNYNIGGKQTENNTISNNKCLISQELRHIMESQMQSNMSNLNNFEQNNVPQAQGNSAIIKIYFKKRAITIVLTIVVLIVLVTNSIFTDMGMNIGAALLRLLGF